MNHPIGNFLLILAAALLSAVVGGLFGAGIAALSPEFVTGIFGRTIVNLVQYAAAAGAVWGVFIGAGAMAFGLLVAAIASWFRKGSR
jgi:hypothetical protein